MTIDGACDEASYTTAAWSDAFTVMDPESKEINGLYIAADKKFTDLQTRATAFFDAQNLYSRFFCRHRRMCRRRTPKRWKCI